MLYKITSTLTHSYVIKGRVDMAEKKPGSSSEIEEELRCLVKLVKSREMD
jgi:hypothetical protein